jgi:uncharacterized protein (UPF0276 family)
MKQLKEKSTPWIGLAYSDYVKDFALKNDHLFDYVEVPYELLKHDPTVFKISEIKPIILHCATLSVAGTIKASEKDINNISYWAEKTKTPWIGEHLSFISTNKAHIEQKYADEYAPGEPYNIGYTMPPPLNEYALKTVQTTLKNVKPSFSMPLILENPPIYFTIPGSQMDQISFIKRLTKETDVGLLLDLAHFYITSKNEGFDAMLHIDDFPLEKVTEVHISGVDEVDETYWDHHASKAPEIIYQLLEKVLLRVSPKAITLEYNWNSKFPETYLIDEINRVKRAIRTCCEVE